MSSRLSKALRELAAALEEVEGDHWEVLSEAVSSATSVAAGANAARGSEGPPAKPEEHTQRFEQASTSVAPPAVEEVKEQKAGPKEASPVCGSTVCYHGDLRHYIVLECPGRPGFIGYVAGPAATTWKKIEKLLPGGRLSGSQARLRRVQSRRQAEELWHASFPNVPMPNLPM